MAADARPYKSKEQDGNGNEIILRDQQLVEQSSQTTMASTEYFEIVDVDGRMAKIPKDNMIGVVREALGTLLNGLADQTTVAKFLTLNGNTLGASAAATAASVLGGLNVNVSSTEDLNSKLELGITYVWASPAPSNAPFAYGNMINIARSSNGVLFQVAFYRATTLKISVRCYDAQNQVFGSWQAIIS